MSKFNVGERVRSIAEGSDTYGRLGTVLEGDRPLGCWVKFAGLEGTFSMYDEWLVLDVPEPTLADLARRVDALEQLAHGHKAEVKMDPNAKYVRCEEKISVGDRVLYTGQKPSRLGRLATVVAVIAEEAHPYRIIFDGEDWEFGVQPGSITKVDPTTQNDALRAAKVQEELDAAKRKVDALHEECDHWRARFRAEEAGAAAERRRGDYWGQRTKAAETELAKTKHTIADMDGEIKRLKEEFGLIQDQLTFCAGELDKKAAVIQHLNGMLQDEQIATSSHAQECEKLEAELAKVKERVDYWMSRAEESEKWHWAVVEGSALLLDTERAKLADAKADLALMDERFATAKDTIARLEGQVQRACELLRGVLNPFNHTRWVEEAQEFLADNDAKLDKGAKK